MFGLYCKEEKKELAIVFSTNASEIIAEASFRMGTARMFRRIDVIRKIVADNILITRSRFPRHLPPEITHLVIGHPSLPA